MSRCRTRVLFATVFAGAIAALILVAGPLSWWLMPAGTDHLSTRDRLAEAQNVRDVLLWMFCAACLPVGWLLGSATRRRPGRVPAGEHRTAGGKDLPAGR
uniref:hypothetical protein n=1 Tax=Amycolatopsis sp. CA-096443 TaxID=3239919 RepID=UPI003F493F61